jgi:hypothetical protein
MQIEPSRWSLAVLGYIVSSVGFATLVFAFLYWIFAFFVWIGASLDKQSFDAGTIVLPVALSIAGTSLVIAGAWVIRITSKSES